MTRAIVLFTAALLLAAGTSFAQNPQPYAGMQARPLKALSGDELTDLREGRGMGLALAGELNGYPGPKHVLELAKELNLTEAQRARTQQLFDDMPSQFLVYLVKKALKLSLSGASRSWKERMPRRKSAANSRLSCPVLTKSLHCAVR